MAARADTLSALVVFSILSTAQGQASCPRVCKCSSNLRSVSCIGQGLEHVPPNIPRSATELYLTRNKLTTIKEHFLQLPNLVLLSLSENVISDIQGGAFTHVPKLKTLYLTNNEIPELKQDVFRGLDNLESLFLGQNKLDTIPDLKFTPNLTTLNFDYNKISSAKFPDGFTNLRRLKSVTLSHNSLKTLRSQDFSALTNSPISKFNLNNCDLTAVENGIFLPFRSLQSLVLSYNDLEYDALTQVIASLSKSQISSLDLSQALTTLQRDVFHPLAHKSLRSLIMKHSSFGALLNGTFEPLSSLYVLDFSYSKISQIEQGTFAPLVRLQRLNMGHCRLDDVPSPLPASLQYLSLSNNNDISEVRRDAFPANSQLQTVDLSHCSLRQIYKESFINLAKVTSLDLSYNSLAGTSIAKGSFMGMSSLMDLTLRNNKLRQISTNSGIFDGLSSLQSLDMSQNDCFELADSIFNPLVQVRSLNLQQNQLNQMIHSGSQVMLFLELKHLKTLNLNLNDIETIGQNAFQGGSNIAYLLLNNNRITHWEAETFKPTVNLTYVDLSVNSISVINKTSVENLSAKIAVNLTANPFYCWCDLVWFRNWLNVTEVTLTDLDRYICASPKEMAQMTLMEFDPDSIKSKCNPPYLFYIVVTAAVTGGIILILCAVAYRLRWKIALRIYQIKQSCNSKKHKTEDPEREALLGQSGEKTFKVMISYGPDDSSTDWVRYKLFPKLENLGLKTFIEDEHVLLGSPYSEQIGKICEAMESCECIVLVLSADFMKNGRRGFEMDYANQMYDASVGSVRILPVIFPESSINTETKARAKIKKMYPGNRCAEAMTWPCDHDGQELFWSKLEEFFQETTDNGRIN